MTPGRSAAFTYDQQPYYKYTPLSQSSTTFRVVRFEPLASNGAVRGTLHERRMDAFEPFTAVSYEWGAPGILHDIFIDDEVFKIRTNLLGCLTELCCRPQGSGAVFIDAICIDQSNKTERIAQVKSMGKIFQHAEEVFAWIGPETPVARGMLSFANWFDEQKSLFKPGISCRPSEDVDGIRSASGPCFTCTTHSPYRSEQAWRECHLSSGDWICSQPDRNWGWRQNLSYQCLECIAETFHKHSYWTRAWMVQEIGQARNLSVNCGQLTVSWERLEVAIIELIPQGLISRGNEFGGKGIYDYVGLRRFLALERGFPVDEGLSTPVAYTAQRNCADHRDRIYGIIGLLKDFREFDVNYDHSGLEVLLRAFMFNTRFPLPEFHVEQAGEIAIFAEVLDIDLPLKASAIHGALAKLGVLNHKVTLSLTSPGKTTHELVPAPNEASPIHALDQQRATFTIDPPHYRSNTWVTSVDVQPGDYAAIYSDHPFLEDIAFVLRPLGPIGGKMSCQVVGYANTNKTPELHLAILNSIAEKIPSMLNRGKMVSEGDLALCYLPLAQALEVLSWLAALYFTIPPDESYLRSSKWSRCSKSG